jgi:hypothetical protein
MGPQNLQRKLGVNLNCIIMFKKKINENGMSEIRFEIAMKCVRRNPI